MQPQISMYGNCNQIKREKVFSSALTWITRRKWISLELSYFLLPTIAKHMYIFLPSPFFISDNKSILSYKPQEPGKCEG